MTKQWVRVKATGEEFRLDRIDGHVHPVCANYRRWDYDEVEIFIRKEDYPLLWAVISNIPENNEFRLPDFKGKL